MKQLYLRSSNDPQLLSISLLTPSIELLKENIFQLSGIPLEDQVLYSNGKILYNSESLEKLLSGAVIDVSLRLIGGKGGLRNTLRGQMQKNVKTENFDSSRDLQGRRIRDVRLKERLIEWARKKKDEDKKIQFEVNEYQRMNKEIVGLRRDVRLPQEFKDKLEKWDYEMSSSVLEGLKAWEKKDVDLEEPMKNKKIFTEKDVLGVIEGRNQAFLESLRKDLIRLEEDIDNENNLEEKQETLYQEETVQKENIEGIKYEEFDLKVIRNIEDLMNLGAEHLKQELKRLGLKCGGSLEERAKRLFEIKMNPNLLFNPKYIAKNKYKKKLYLSVYNL